MGIRNVEDFVRLAIDTWYSTLLEIDIISSLTLSIMLTLYRFFLIGTVSPRQISNPSGPFKETILAFSYSGLKQLVLPVILNVKAFIAVYTNLSHSTTIVLLVLQV